MTDEHAMADGYKTRKVRYEKIHNVSDADFDALAAALEMRDEQVIGDFCSGYGAVTREMLSRTEREGINVSFVLADCCPDQLERSYAELPNKAVSRMIADVRDLPFRDNYFDRIVIKMGLHEMPFVEQQKAVNEVYRVLKPAGIFALWNVLATDETEQSLFAAIIREKDRLAGFDSLARDRYLQREDQVRSLLKNAGFDNVERVWDINHNLSTYKRLDAEFGGDRSRLESWNNFIRNHFPEHLRQRFSYVDVNGDIMMQFKQGIIRCVKPLPYSQNERRNS